MTRKFIRRIGLTVLLSSLGVSAYGFGGEDFVDGGPWHHHDITLRALSGDAVAYGDMAPKGGPEFKGMGFNQRAAQSIAWHADNIDSYLYNPYFWLKDVLPASSPTDAIEKANKRLKGAFAGYDDLAKLHFDDTFSTPGMIDNYERYAAGTLIGLSWAAENRDQAAAHAVLGVSLHAIQDFYSHTNWVDDPKRRDRTWFEFTPEERAAMDLYSGSYETNSLHGAKEHGAYSFSCSIMKQDVIGDVLETVCGGTLSPMQNMGFCDRYNKCDEAVPIDVSLSGFTEGPMVYLDTAGMAIDSTLVTRIGGKTRGLTTDKAGGYKFTALPQNRVNMTFEECTAIVNYGMSYADDDTGDMSRSGPDGRCQTDTDLLFAAAKKLSIRASEQWVGFIESAMIEAGHGDFWNQMKRIMPRRDYRTSQYEDFKNLPYHFLATGPYPVANTGIATSSDGYYLRIRLQTAKNDTAGTDADIWALVEGDGFSQSFLLDYLPTNDPDGRVNNRLLVYNDFEQGDNDVYTIGPIPGRPLRLTLVNDSGDAGEVFMAVLKGIADAFIGIAESAESAALAIVGGGADYVNDDKRFFTTNELIMETKLAGGRYKDELRMARENEGDFGVRYQITHAMRQDMTMEQRAAGWSRFNVTFDKLHAYKESEIDRASNSDEIILFASTAPLNGLPDQKVLTLRPPIIEDVDDDEDHTLIQRDGSHSMAFNLPPTGSVAIASQIYESDVEGSGRRDAMWDEFTSTVKQHTLSEDRGVLDELGRAIAADWTLNEIEVDVFRRSNRPAFGKVLKQIAIRAEIEGDEARSFNLSEEPLTEILTSGQPDAGMWYVAPQGFSAPVETSSTDAPAVPGTGLQLSAAARDKVAHIKLDALSDTARRRFNNVRFRKFNALKGPMMGTWQSNIGEMHLIHIGDDVHGSINNYAAIEGKFDKGSGKFTGQLSYQTVDNGQRVFDLEWTLTEQTLEGNGSFVGEEDTIAIKGRRNMRAGVPSVNLAVLKKYAGKIERPKALIDLRKSSAIVPE